jgi:glycerol uptake facilitator-like aquaporin
VQDRGPAAYIAEFVGTLLLVFFITAVVSLYFYIFIQPGKTGEVGPGPVG